MTWFWRLSDEPPAAGSSAIWGKGHTMHHLDVKLRFAISVRKTCRWLLAIATFFSQVLTILFLHTKHCPFIVGTHSGFHILLRHCVFSVRVRHSVPQTNSPQSVRGLIQYIQCNFCVIWSTNWVHSNMSQRKPPDQLTLPYCTFHAADWKPKMRMFQYNRQKSASDINLPMKAADSYTKIMDHLTKSV